MKNKPLILFFALITFWSCSENSNVILEPVSITFTFNHFWQTEEVNTASLPLTTYTNEYGTELTIDDVRYLISDIQLVHESGVTTTINEYNLIDVDDDTGLTFETSAAVLPGEYTSVSFRFGFSEEDNTTGAYPDLTSVNFDVPETLGGGYHYMQMDGQYTDESNVETSFNFHVISAIDMSAATPTREDTSFRVELGAVTVSNNTHINVGVDFYEWFSNPNIWNLNDLDVLLMGNYEAQQDMFENGQSGVFSLIDVTEE